MFHSNAPNSIIKVVVVISFTHTILTLNVGITSFLSHLCSKLSHQTAQTIRCTYNNRLSHSPNNKNKLNYLSLTCTLHSTCSFLHNNQSSLHTLMEVCTLYSFARYKTPFMHTVTDQLTDSV